MTIVLLTLGTRGDVQPFVALGLHLRQRGHRVRICTCERFKEFITSRGLEYGYLDDGILRFVESDRVREMIGTRSNKLLLYHPKALGGAHIAEKLGIPGFCVPPFPAYVPTGAFPMFIFGTRSWGASCL